MTNTKGKIDDPKLRERVLALAKEAGEPFGVTFAAKRLNIAWVTARAILTKLVNEQVLAGTRTSQGTIFYLRGQLKEVVIPA